MSMVTFILVGTAISSNFELFFNYHAVANLIHGEVVSDCHIKMAQTLHVNGISVLHILQLSAYCTLASSPKPLDNGTSQPANGFGLVQLLASKLHSEATAKTKNHSWFPRFALKPCHPNSELIYCPSPVKHELHF